MNFKVNWNCVNLFIKPLNKLLYYPKSVDFLAPPLHKHICCKAICRKLIKINGKSYHIITPLILNHKFFTLTLSFILNSEPRWYLRKVMKSQMILIKQPTKALSLPNWRFKKLQGRQLRFIFKLQIICSVRRRSSLTLPLWGWAKGAPPASSLRI